MTSEDIQSYLTNIEESLFDEKRIVTYIWLSKTFGIHCNLSKQLLYTFFENSPKKEELSVTYLLIGVPNNVDSCQVLIVKDKDLLETESNLKSITSKHIYSIQKCQELTDINVLYTPQAEESTDCLSKGISAIEFKSKERDNILIAKLKQEALPTLPAQPSTSKKVNEQPVNKPKSPVKNTNNESDNKITSGEQNKKSDSKTENKKTVTPSMFGNAAGQKKKPAEKPPAANNKKPVNNKGIGAFFMPATKKPNPENDSKKSVEIEKKEVQNKEKEEKSDSPVIDIGSHLKENKPTLNICTESDRNNKIVKVTDESPKESPVKPKKAETKTKTSSKKTATNKQVKKKATKKSDNAQKKRKRLVVLSDSDSNNSSEDEDGCQREPTPEPVPTFIPDEDEDDLVYGTPEPSKKRKKRKQVNRTYKDEDGFIVTEKHYEDVSASEDEDPVPEKKFKESSPEHSKDSEKNIDKKLKDKKESPKNKNPSPQKVKQTSLTSFFKKK